MKNAIILTILTTTIFSIMSYWGIRSPDSEVVFRTTQALATKGTFAITEELSWEGFGIAKGKDGKLYSIFGPGEAIIAVPLYKLAERINSTEWYQHANSLVSKSHYVNNGLLDFVRGRTPEDLEPHALRMVVSLLNIITASLCVFIFFFTVKALTQSDLAALFTSVLFAFGSLIFPYSGTFFSEILATFFVMLSFYILVYNKLIKKSHGLFYLLFSGIFLGLATATHITAILFAPFFCMYGAWPGRSNTRASIKPIILKTAIFSAGFGLLLALLAYFNFIRFDNIFETGRTVGSNTSAFGYGVSVAPWQGLWGLLFGAGKGLLLFCPAITLSLFLWRPFHKKHRFLSFTILAAALLRILFIASRSDWHGGFCLGPRYMVMLIPFLMLPIGEWINKIIASRNTKAIFSFFLFSLVCIAQQIYFSLGEIFSFLHIIKWNEHNRGVDVFKDNLIYLSWDRSPLLFLLKGKRGPLFLNFIKTTNYTLCLNLIFLATLFLCLFYFFALKNISASGEVINEENQR